MAGDAHTVGREHADAGWDDYAERVLRNEGRLLGLEVLVAETREADRKLIEQRSESLARELERRAEALLELVTARADAVLALGAEERHADTNTIEVWKTEHEKLMASMREGTRRESELALGLLREVYDKAIHQNYEQSREAISALEQRQQGATDKLEQMVRQWRDSDREARELFATETQRHLEQLNHNNERMASFQAQSVTRELWQAEKDAAIAREGLLRDQIIAIDRSMLTMMPVSVADKAHAEMLTRMETSIAASAQVLDNKIVVVNEKVSDLKTYRDTSAGRMTGVSALLGWIFAAVTLLVAVIVGANAIFNNGS